MNKVVVGGAAILVTLVSVFLFWHSGKDERFAREVMSSTLKDSQTAEFRNLERHGENVLCGEVNAKNSYGAFIGFTKFAVIGTPGPHSASFAPKAYLEDGSRALYEIFGKDC